jgi:hypothetical protein
MADDGFTTVHVTTDPVEGEMLVEALQGEAIEARLVRVNSALLGAGPQIFETRIDVADDAVPQARALLAELRHPGLMDEHVEPEPSEDPAALKPRQPFKAGIGLLLPGGGHYFARRTWTATVLQAGILACLVVLVLDVGPNFLVDAVYVTTFALVVTDVVGGFAVVRAQNRGAPVPNDWRRQLLRGVALVALASTAGAATAAVVAVPRWLRERDLATLVVSCTDRDLTFSNTGASGRYVSLDRVGTTSALLESDGAYEAKVSDATVMGLAAGMEATRAYAAHPRIADDCHKRGVRGDLHDCGLRFQLTVQATEPDATLMTAWGRCAPDWSGGHAASPATLTLHDAP